MAKSRLLAVRTLGTLGSIMAITLCGGLALALPPTLPPGPQPAQPIKTPTERVSPSNAPTARPPALDGGASARVPCEVTHAGADGNGTRTCTIVMQFDTATNHGGILLKGVAGYGPTVTPEAIFRVGPTVPTAGPLPSTLYTVSYQAIIPGHASPVSFVASNIPNQQPLQGNASVTLTSVSPNGAPNGTVQDYLIHGTMDATVPALPRTPASGTVTIHVAF
jgi:hypothetical protein